MKKYSECECDCHKIISDKFGGNHVCCEADEPSEECTCYCHDKVFGNPVITCKHCQPSENVHKIGEHGAVSFVTQGKDICAECREPVEG